MHIRYEARVLEDESAMPDEQREAMEAIVGAIHRWTKRIVERLESPATDETLMERYNWAQLMLSAGSEGVDHVEEENDLQPWTVNHYSEALSWQTFVDSVKEKAAPMP